MEVKPAKPNGKEIKQTLKHRSKLEKSWSNNQEPSSKPTQFNVKMRQLRLRMADDTIRSVVVDENQPVANLMVIICTKLGMYNIAWRSSSADHVA